MTYGIAGPTGDGLDVIARDVLLPADTGAAVCGACS